MKDPPPHEKLKPWLKKHLEAAGYFTISGRFWMLGVVKYQRHAAIISCSLALVRSEAELSEMCKV